MQFVCNENKLVSRIINYGLKLMLVADGINSNSIPKNSDLKKLKEDIDKCIMISSSTKQIATYDYVI